MLSAAYRHWQALTGMSDPQVFADEIFGLHAQQAVEKALKAWLTLLGVEYPRTHDLSMLLNDLAKLGQEVGRFHDLVEFNPYAVQYRYEAFEDMGDPLDRSNVTHRVAQLLQVVETLIGLARDFRSQTSSLARSGTPQPTFRYLHPVPRLERLVAKMV
jgi:HEPN domain-containing protein